MSFESSRYVKEFRQIPEHEKNVERKYPDKESVAYPTYEKAQEMLNDSLEELIVFSDREGESEEIAPLIFDKGNNQSGLTKQLQEVALTGEKDSEGKYYAPLLVRRGHHRAAEMPLPEALVDQRREQYGKANYYSIGLYNVLNVKGLGFLFPESYESRKENYYGKKGQPTVETKASDEEYPWGTQVLGMFDGRLFETLRKNTELIIRHGGRVENILAAYQIEACFFEGELKTIEELKEKGVIPKEAYEDHGEFVPLEVFRLQRSNIRVKDFSSADTEEKKKMLSEVFQSLNKEFKTLQKIEKQSNDEIEKVSINKQLSRMSGEYDQDNHETVGLYLENSAYWVGKNLGIIESLGRFITYYNSGNVTMAAGELVDLDSVDELNAKDHINVPAVVAKDRTLGENLDFQIPPAFLKDIRDALLTLKILAKSVEKTVSLDQSSTRKKMKEA
ncbi:hypothetical protein KKC60_04185, partial [Patescibacteria group bacterium]|nr:hypothetical protein [Patescibacteria group bacterium]